MEFADKLMILHIDGCEGSLKLTRRWLETAGYVVMSCTTGIAALELLDTFTPAMIILDAQGTLSESDGFEFCAQLQSRRHLARAPIVFLTERFDQTEKARAFASGAVDYLVKPVCRARLLAAVGKCSYSSGLWKDIGSTKVSLKDTSQFVGFLFEALHRPHAQAERFAKVPAENLYCLATELGVDEEVIARHLAQFLMYPYLAAIDVKKVNLGILPVSFCRTRMVIPIEEDGENSFAVANPLAWKLLDDIKALFGKVKNPRILVTRPRNIRDFFEAASIAGVVPPMQCVPSRKRFEASSLPGAAPSAAPGERIDAAGPVAAVRPAAPILPTIERFNAIVPEDEAPAETPIPPSTGRIEAIVSPEEAPPATPVPPPSERLDTVSPINAATPIPHGLPPVRRIKATVPANAATPVPRGLTSAKRLKAASPATATAPAARSLPPAKRIKTAGPANAATPAARSVASGKRIQDKAAQDNETQLSGIHLVEEVLEEVAEDSEESAPVIVMVNKIIDEACRQGASDIHIEPWEKEVVVRYRVDGDMRQIRTLQPQEIIRPLVARIKIMSNLSITERRLPQDGRIVYKDDIDLRVSTIPSNYGERVVMRLLDKKKSAQPLDSLGFSNRHLKLYREKIKTPYGMILHVGPTGSGKSMTLFAALKEIQTPETTILTIEDPIEYTLPGISQVQVHQQVGLTFARGLRSFLRQDPDVILVGEIRDRETADVAVQASLTGHLMFSTLHTNDSAETITRLIEMGIEPYMISSSLVMICGQRLLRRLCLTCRTAYAAGPDEKRLVGVPAAQELSLYHSGSCPACSGTGYKGRIGVHEILVMDDALRAAMSKKGVSADELKRLAVEKSGMTTLYLDSMEKVQSGITSIDEVIAQIRPDDVVVRPRINIQKLSAISSGIHRHTPLPSLMVPAV